MNHQPKTLLVCFVLIISAGCVDTRQQPQIKGIKIGELAPRGRHAQSLALRTTDIDVIDFELPAENIKSLDTVWQILTTDSLRYNDPDSFAANGLQAATSEFGTLDKVNKILISAQAKKLSATSLLIPNGQSAVLGMGRLTRKTTISYIGRQGAIENVQAGPGILGLQVSARQWPGKRPIASVRFVPIIAASTVGLAPELAEQIKESDLRIYSAGFGLIMKPGDFVLLTPSRYNADETTAASRFFTKPGPKPAVRVLLLVCTSVTQG